MRRSGESAVNVTLGEVSRKLDEMRQEVRNWRTEVDRRFETEVVPIEVYRSEATARDERIDSLHRSLSRIYAFISACVVAVIGASATAVGALIVAVIIANKHL